MARRIIAAVLCGYVLNSLLAVAAADLPAERLYSFVACLVAVLALQFLHSTRDTLAWPVWIRLITLAAQAVFTFMPLLWVGPQASAVAGFLAGSMLLTIAGRVRWALYVAVGAAVLMALTVDGLPPVDVLYGTYFILLTGLMVYGVSSLGNLVSVVYSARGELARTAVARERLRVARDLHDLLGFNVSAMTLRSELAYRLLPRATDLAKQELTEVLRIARQALADVRAVASGYQPMSLAAEVESAEAMLSAVEIHTDVRIEPGDVRREVETVLAIVLREAVTNVLRHGKAERCTITATREPGRIRLQVSNDGADPEPDRDRDRDTAGRHGTGLANLADRLGWVGGALTTSVKGHWFHLTAVIPLAPGRTARSLLDDASLPEGAGSGISRWRRNRPWHLRVARLIAAVVILGYAALIVVNVLPASQRPAHLIGFAACVAVQAAILLTCALSDVGRWPGWLRVAVLVPQALATVLPLAWLGSPWGSMGGPFGATLLLVLSRRIRWPLFIMVGAGIAALGTVDPGPGAWRAYLIISTLLTGLALYGIGSLSRLVVQVNHAHDELMRMAVTRERLRVVRNLHDLLGRDLSRIAVASRTAHRYLEEEPDLAKEEVAEGLDIARRAVAKVRAVASGYRRMSLAAEIDSAVSILEAARIDVHVHLPEREVPHDVDSVLAVALREAVMNVLRHSDAHWCGIRVEATGGRVRLEVANDGAGTLTDPALDSGSGLGDLATRVELVGGTVAGASDSGRFHLSIELPTVADDRIARSFSL
jgi:signal transduction histidine kinase